MQKKNVAAILCSLFMIFGLTKAAWAGDAKVQWKLSDNQTSEESMAKIDETFAKLAKALPSGFQLEVNVSLLKTAVAPDNSNQLQKSITMESEKLDANAMASRERTPSWPRMHFEYTLKDSTGTVVKTGYEELKDMDYLNQARARYGEYEANMVKDWFRKQQQSKAFPVAAH